MTISSVFSLLCFVGRFIASLLLGLVLHWHAPPDDEATLLVVGILSARDHFQLRQAIRATWMQRWAGPHVRAWFIVGERGCDIHPDDRTSPLSCLPHHVDPSQLSTDGRLASAGSVTRSCQGELQMHPAHQGFSFKVHHPIVIDRLGVVSDLLPPGSQVNITFVDAATKAEVVSASIWQSAGGKQDGFLWQPIDAYLLPKGFEGIILASGLLYGSYGCPHWAWNDGAGIISITRVYASSEDSDALDYEEDLLAAPVASFTIPDVQELQRHAAGAQERADAWRKESLEEALHLQQEISKFGDIFVASGVVDVYANIPRKLTTFITWASSQHRFRYLMKTDDDSIVDIPSLMKAISVHHGKVVRPAAGVDDKVWFGRVRRNWPVNYFGKWAEYGYGAAVYPPFMCGSGYVVTRPLAGWLAANCRHLHFYQGEDVSMGIWLAAVNHTIADMGHLVSCDASCASDTIIRAELSVRSIYEAWDAYSECGTICQCAR